FIQVLELREGKDLLGAGYHEGGCFDNRDGRQKDTVALSSLPSVITSYFSSSYPQDTLIKASKTRSGDYLILSKNNSLYATTFDSSGTFLQRVQVVPRGEGRVNVVDQNSLPASVASYLNITYPGYVFDKAFSITVNGIVQGYCIVIDANNTKYGLLFDATGNFVEAKIIM
ncbi:MAG: PepSY-like domain-containing protein, partial [Ginsengibacter sp.]